MNRDTELQRAASAARHAAALLTSAFAADAGVESRHGHDIKTRADVAAEDCIKEHLAGSGIPVFAEESATGTTSNSAALRWLVDPLDGTMNFTRRFPICGVSIGLWDGDAPVLGAIYDLGQRTIYTGIVGQGAWCDGKPMHTSVVTEQSQAILATGFPTGRDYESAALGKFVGRIQTFKKIRMIGSAALSLARVAEGVFDAYYEEDIMIWDVAAGLALVAAAGGQIEVGPGARPHSVVCKATNGHLTSDF